MTEPLSEDNLTRDQLPYDALVRLDHAGEWVAWDSDPVIRRDTARAVAFGADMEAVRNEALKAGVARPVMEWVPPHPVRLTADDLPAPAPEQMTERNRQRWEAMTPEQRAHVERVRALHATPEYRAEEERVREAVRAEFPPRDRD